MKDFNTFREDASSDAGKSISASNRGGGSDVTNIKYDQSFKKRPKTGIGAALSKLRKDRQDKKKADGKPEGAGPTPTDGPGQRADRKANPYRQKTQRDQGGALAKRPEEKGSMVARKSAASKQPPQHKQLAARPASTAMAGSRQKKAIRPAPERKALPQGQERKALPQGQRRIAAQPVRKALPPGRG